MSGPPGLPGANATDAQVANAVAEWMVRNGHLLIPTNGASSSDLQAIETRLKAIEEGKRTIVLVRDGKPVKAREYGLFDDQYINVEDFVKK